MEDQPGTYYTYMETCGKSETEQVNDAVKTLNSLHPWKEGDPHRILFFDDIQNGDTDFWIRLINNGFAWKNHITIVAAMTYKHVQSPRFSPLLAEDSIISFQHLRLTGEEEGVLLKNIMTEKTNLQRLDHNSKVMILNAVSDQCQGHVFALMVSLDKLDDFAKVKTENCESILSHLLSKQFWDNTYTRIWPPASDDFTEDSIKELQDAMMHTDKAPDNGNLVSIDNLLMRVLRTFKRVDLLQSCHASEGNFPKEGALQQMFFYGLVSNLPASTEVVAEMSVILPRRGDRKRGELDFYVNSKYFYGIELMRKGGNFAEHKQRFLPGGKYFTPLIRKYRIVDFQSTGFRAKNHDSMRITVEFDKDYNGCTVWSGGEAVDTVSF